jgi:hypothetical protein
MDCDPCSLCIDGECRRVDWLQALPACNPSRDASTEDAVASDGNERDLPDAQDAGASDAQNTADAQGAGEQDAQDASVFPDAAADAAPRDAGRSPPSQHAFRVTSLGTSSCAVAATQGANGTYCRRIGWSVNQVFTECSTYARFPWTELAAGTPSGTPASDFDTMVTDLETGTSYILSNGSTPLIVAGTATVTATHFMTLDDDTGEPTGSPRPLSHPIAIFNANVGLFSGVGRFVAHTGTSAFDVSLADGMVTDLGPSAPPPGAQPCYGGGAVGTSGIAEFFDGSIHLLYVTGSQQISRYRLSDGALSIAATFSNLGPMCVFSVAPRFKRWTFTVPEISQFVGTLNVLAPYENGPTEVTGTCEASFDTPGDPPSPVFVSTTPASPSTSTAFTVNGEAEPGTLIRLYSARTCRTATLSSGAADPSGRFSISVSVMQNARTTLFGTAQRPGGTKSLCGPGPTLISNDVRPTFSGAARAIAFGTNVALLWPPASDTLARPEDLRYEICVATAPRGCNPFRADVTTSPGALRASIRGLQPGIAYYFVVRALNLGGITDLNQIEVSATTSAVPSRQFRVDSLDLTGCSSKPDYRDLIDVFATVVGSASAFSYGDNLTARYDLEGLSHQQRVLGTVTTGYNYIVGDLAAGSVYALLDGDGNPAWIRNSPIIPAVITGFVRVDPSTGLRIGPRVDLSEPIQLVPNSGIFSGIDRFFLHDSIRLVEIDPLSGLVTLVARIGLPQVGHCANLRITQGIAEEFGGSIHLLFSKPTISGLSGNIARFDVSTGAVESDPSYAVSTICGIGFSPLYSRWYWSEQNAIHYCNATYDQPPAPDAGSRDASQGLDGGASHDSGVPITTPCLNGSTTDCDPPGSTFAPFVDPNPPAGYLQCAGFINTPAYAIEFNWFTNCEPYFNGDLWIRTFDDATGSLIAGAHLTPGPSCNLQGEFVYLTDQQEGLGFYSDASCGPKRMVINWGGNFFSPSCRGAGPPFSANADIWGATRDGSQIFEASSGENTGYGAFYAPSCQTQSIRTRIRVALYVRANAP